MRVRRIYAAHRRAYTPRIWPIALATCVTIAALDLLLAPGTLAAAAIGAGVGLGIGVTRWELWKHRHPVITLDQYITDLQRKARWN
jgi:peptidoglycan/LPS O-acetylase OafA/YrhL